MNSLLERAILPVDDTGLESSAPSSQGFVKPEDGELEDLIFSWRRLRDPRLRKIALNVVRSMACRSCPSCER